MSDLSQAAISRPGVIFRDKITELGLKTQDAKTRGAVLDIADEFMTLAAEARSVKPRIARVALLAAANRYEIVGHTKGARSAIAGLEMLSHAASLTRGLVGSVPKTDAVVKSRKMLLGIK